MNETESNRQFIIILFIISGILLFFLNIGLVARTLDEIYSKALYPGLMHTHKNAEVTKEYLNVLTHVSRIRRENIELQAKVARLEGMVEKVSIVYEQNRMLREQLGLPQYSENLIDVYVFQSDQTPVGAAAIYVNHGSDVGVHTNDPIIIGDTIAGYIGNVEEYRSSVIPLTTLELSNEALIIHTEKGVRPIASELDKYLGESVIVSGVAVGTSKEVRIENIAMDVVVSEGDAVYIKDSHSGDLYYLGRISNVQTSSSATAQEADLSLALNIEDLNYAFVKIK